MDCQENSEHQKARAKIDRVAGLRNGNTDTAQGFCRCLACHIFTHILTNVTVVTINNEAAK